MATPPFNPEYWREFSEIMKELVAVGERAKGATREQEEKLQKELATLTTRLAIIGERHGPQ